MPRRRRIPGMDPDEYPTLDELAQDERERRLWEKREREGRCGHCGVEKPNHRENCVVAKWPEPSSSD